MARVQYPDAVAGETYHNEACDVESVLSNLAVDCMQIGATEKAGAAHPADPPACCAQHSVSTSVSTSHL